MGFGLIIVGTKYRTKNVSPPSGYTDMPCQYCPFCRSYQHPAFLRTDKWFTFFFIPLLRLKKDHNIQVKCSSCKNNMVLPPKGPLSTYAKNTVDRGSSAAPLNPTSAVQCPTCAQPWNPENKFCPNDGTPRPDL